MSGDNGIFLILPIPFYIFHLSFFRLYLIFFYVVFHKTTTTYHRSFYIPPLVENIPNYNNLLFYQIRVRLIFQVLFLYARINAPNLVCRSFLIRIVRVNHLYCPLCDLHDEYIPTSSFSPTPKHYLLLQYPYLIDDFYVSNIHSYTYNRIVFLAR